MDSISLGWGRTLVPIFNFFAWLLSFWPSVLWILWQALLRFEFLCLINCKQIERMPQQFNFDVLYPDDEPFAVVFDVETTGLIAKGEGRPTKQRIAEDDTAYPRIVSIAWIVLSRNYRAVRKGAHIIQQTAPIPKQVIAIHGITDEMAAEHGQPLAAVLQRFASDVADCTHYVGYHVTFDERVVEADCIRAGLPSPFGHKQRCDVLVMARPFMRRERFKLRELVERAQVTTEHSPSGFHNSQYDTVVTAALFCALHPASKTQ